MSPTVAPNKYYHQELVMTTEVSPTGIEVFDSHFNFYNASRSICTNITTTEDDGNIEDGVMKSSDTTSSNHHQSSPENIKSSPPITSPLLEQASIQIQVAAAEFIEEPTTEHWERLVHLFCVERLLGQKHQQPPLEEEGQCDIMGDDGTLMHTIAAKKDLVHDVTNVSNSVGCNDDEHDDSFCTAHENEEELNEDSFRTANESEEESSVDFEHEDSFRTANEENEEESSDEEEEDIVAVEPPVDNDDEEDDEHAMIIKAAQSIHLEGSTSRKALVSNPWMDAFHLAYQLL
ncbi:hypothetical protein QTG54_015019 [Skeletonema marinoi]|uniref:Uncharacterized protein n=1 Tax=Skeletonema marinoi TaxID=267567 RepID=A0AAD8XV31_9STRA|nr:hypothetical protein QTG54_015019 [Skeletonema marinoi]